MDRRPKMGGFLVRCAMPALIMACALLSGTPAFAVNEKVSVSQNPDGTIVATLSGANSPCAFVFTGPPTVVASGGNFTVTSAIALPGAPCPPGPVVLTSYSISINLGAIPDGTHTVTWTFLPLLMPSVSATFTISGGLLAPPPTVPTLSPLALAILGLLLLLSAHRLRFRPS